MVPDIQLLIEEAGSTGSFLLNFDKTIHFSIRKIKISAILMSTLLDRFRETPSSRILPISELETTLQRVIQDCRQLLLYLNNALRLWDRQQQHRSIVGVNGDDGPVASRTRGALRRLSGTASGTNRKPRVKRPVRGRR